MFLTTAIAQTFNTIASFTGSNGSLPGYVSLVQGLDGNFYGTTGGGGDYANGSYRTVFKITPDGTLTTLHSFNLTKGAYPYAGLTLAINGDFHGTTRGGGANNYGTIFKITPTGTLTLLHSFDGNASSTNPMAPLVQATSGDLYGTTEGCGATDCGTIFKITPWGKFTTLHTFSLPNDGLPNGGLIQASGGNLYGTTEGVGARSYGTIFKITPAGNLTTIHSFCSQTNCADGLSPQAPLVQVNDWNFYWTSSGGGANGDYATIFKVTTAGKLTTIL